jgi:hypothetical protein
MMDFETRCLEIVKSVTAANAYFFSGTMFLNTKDSKIATQVYSALSVNNQTIGIVFGLAGDETFYDFV